MRLRAAAAASGALGLSLGLWAGLALGEGPDRQPAPKTPKCVDVRTFSRYGALGYDHVVEIENRCDKAVLCLITTNANPEAARLEVKPGETGSVVTFRGSPAREFEADVTCERKG